MESVAEDLFDYGTPRSRSARGNRAGSVRLFFLGEYPLALRSFDRQLPFRSVEFEDDPRIDLELVLGGCFERDTVWLGPSSNVKRRSIPDNCHFRGSSRDRVNADVSVQNFRAKGDPVQRGDLKRPIPVNVENAAHDLAHFVDLRIRRIDRKSTRLN